MGKVQSTQSNPSYDDYTKGGGKKTEKPVHNQELNDRIQSLTESINKPTVTAQDLSNIKTHFNKEFKSINASIGDKGIQASLLKLKDKIREKFDNKESHELAFQIQCTAQAMTPDMTFEMEDLPVELPNLFELEKLPAEVQQLIFSEVGANATTDKPFNELLVSKQVSKNVPEVKNEWINANHISLKTLGCKSAKEAIDYVIAHQLTSANLSEFQDLSDEDLLKLSQKCPLLEKLSIHSYLIGEKSIVVLERLTNLQSLAVWLCVQLPGKEFVEVLAKLTKLQSLNVWGCDQLPGKEFVEALEKLTNLRSLNVNWCPQLPGKEFVEALKKLPNLQSLSVALCDQLPVSDIRGKFPHLIIED